MKRAIKYIGLFLILLIPFNVFGISYTLGNPYKGKDGVTYVDIKVSGVTGLKQTEALSCSTTDKDKVDCEIEVSPDGKNLSKEGRIIVSTVEFTEDQTVGRLAIKNKTYELVSTKAIFEVNEAAYGNPIENIQVDKAKKPASKDSTLHKLSINNGTINPDFKADVTEYTVFGISDTINKIKFTYECDNCKVNNTSIGTTEISQGLTIGENNIQLKVTSEDGTDSTTYSFKVFRGETTYNSLKLKSLSVDNCEISPKFDANTKEYEVKISKKAESIAALLKYETEDPQAKVKVEGADKLENDENTVKIIVTNQTGDTAEYILKVIKEDETQAVIEVIGYKDNKVSFMNTEGVREELGEEEFKNKYPDEWKKIEDKVYQFDDEGNIIKEKNESKNTNSTEKKENKFPWVIVILVIVSLVIIGVAGFVIFRDPNKKKENKDNKVEPIAPVEPEQKVDVTPIVPAEEIQAELNRIDTYDEEARLEAENAPIEPPVVEEQVVQEETIDDYVDDDKTPTTDIDQALSDLMNTKEYNFKDKE